VACTMSSVIAPLHRMLQQPPPLNVVYPSASAFSEFGTISGLDFASCTSTSAQLAMQGNQRATLLSILTQVANTQQHLVETIFSSTVRLFEGISSPYADYLTIGSRTASEAQQMAAIERHATHGIRSRCL
jgi:hypothetical protein